MGGAYVFVDEKIKESTDWRHVEELVNFLQAQGFKRVGVEEIEEVFHRGGVVVMACWTLPAWCVEAAESFLKRGGKIIWFGAPPFHNCWDGEKFFSDIELYYKFLNMPVWTDSQEFVMARPTDKGRDLGFFFSFPVIRSFDKGFVDVVLAETIHGRAAAWVRKKEKGEVYYMGDFAQVRLEIIVPLIATAVKLAKGYIPKFVEKIKTDPAWAYQVYMTGGIEALANEKEPSMDYKLYFLPQSHLDFCWLWDYDRTIEKMKMTSLRALKNFFKFGDNMRMNMTSPAFYWFLENYAPNIFLEIKHLIKKGVWDPVTGDWVEHDCNLPSGESMARQRLQGQRYLREKFGISSKISWMPDTFGFPKTLPQILKKGGEDYFFTNKLGWTDSFLFPLHLFKWRSPDGSEVLVYNNPSAWGCGTLLVSSPALFKELTDGSPVYEENPPVLNSINLNYKIKERAGIVLITFGEGDGGGGPSESSYNYVLSIKEIFGPQAEIVTAKEFFEKIKELKDKLAVWEDELYLPYHRGTYTSQWIIKWLNRRGENSLYRIEFLSSLLHLIWGVEYPATEINRAWREFLLYQFHDPLPGSSIKKVYEEARENIPKYVFALEERVRECLEDMLKGEGVTVVNTNPYRVRFYVESEMGVPSGTPSQTRDGKSVFVMDLPAGGFSAFPAGVPVRSKEKPAEGKIYLENEFYKVGVDSGRIISIYDKAENIELLKTPIEIIAYSDKPKYWDNWEISQDYYRHPMAHFVPSKCFYGDGPVFCYLTMEGVLASSPFKWEIRLYKGLKFVESRLWTDWKNHRVVVKMWIDPVCAGDRVVTSIPFGHYERPFKPRSEAEEVKWEFPHQGWVSITNGKCSFHIINDCLYGSGVVEGRYGLTLLKAGVEPDPDADNYEHNWKLLFYHNKGSWQEGEPWKIAQVFNNPAFVLGKGEPGRSESFIEVDGAVLSAFKKWEDGDGYVVRFFCPSGSERTVKVELPFTPAAVKEINFLEDVINEKPAVRLSKNTLTFKLAPWEVKTLLLVVS